MLRVLGPIIFLVLIGDIDDDVLESIVKSFADDTRVTKGVCSIQDSTQLQNDLEKVYQWTKKNIMLLNDVKGVGGSRVKKQVELIYKSF